jgi:putative addiction module killer protein
LIALRQTQAFLSWRAGLRDERFRNALAKRLIRIQAGLVGDAKYVGDGVSELRFDLGPGYRVYLCRRGDELVILLCGGSKSSQVRDIALAKAMAADLEK